MHDELEALREQRPQHQLLLSDGIRLASANGRADVEAICVDPGGTTSEEKFRQRLPCLAVTQR